MGRIFRLSLDPAFQGWTRRPSKLGHASLSDQEVIVLICRSRIDKSFYDGIVEVYTAALLCRYHWQAGLTGIAESDGRHA